MDMAVASLFKHKIRFELTGQGGGIEEPTLFMTYRNYRSPDLENVKSLGINNVDDLSTVYCKPFILYALSKIVHEDRVIPINEVKIIVGVADFQEGEDYDLALYCFEWPLNSPELFFTNSEIYFTSFPERLLNVRTYVFVDVKCYYYCGFLREEARFRREFNCNAHWHLAYSVEEYLENTNSANEILDEEVYVLEEEYTPPIETYRQDFCVVCLEAKPNILYLDCLHIAICDSCDRLKTSSRKNCDVCRAEISKRIKI